MMRRLKMTLAGAVIALALLTGTVRPVAAQQLTPVHLASVTNDTCSAVLYAIKAGLFRKAGLDVDFQGLTSGAAASAAVVGGSAQFGQSSLVTLIDAHTRGIPFTLVAPSGLITSNVMYAAAIVRKDSPIKSARDLDGKTFAVPALMDLNQIAAMAWIDQNGGDSRTVKFIEMPVSSTIAAIEEGRIDSGQVGTPGLTIALDGGKTRVLAQIFNALGKQFENTVWFTTTGYATAHPDVVAQFAAVMHAHHAETQALIAEYLKVDPRILASMTRVEFADYLRARDIQPLIDAAVKYKAIDRTFPAQDIISPLALKAPR
jgi:NitT/TauT family transport system substrate-binding protein